MKDWWKNSSFTKDDRDWKDSVEVRLEELHHMCESPKPVPKEEGNE